LTFLAGATASAFLELAAGITLALFSFLIEARK
jgi:hypothetical protein